MLAEEHTQLVHAPIHPSKLMSRNNFVGYLLFLAGGAYLLLSCCPSPQNAMNAPILHHRSLANADSFSQHHRGLSIATYDRTTERVLPAYLQNAANVWDMVQTTDQPFFWYLPKSGGLSWQKIVANCLNLISASARGIEGGESLDIIRGPDDGLYLNVNPGTPEGIKRAAELGLVSSGMADIYFSHWLVPSMETLFPPTDGGTTPTTTTYHARLFVMMRHPTKRLIDEFYYQQRATWVGVDHYDADLGQMSLAEFAASNKFVENVMVRSLCALPPEQVEVTVQDVELAKDILRRKFLVGILDWIDLSMARFEKYFGWWDAHSVSIDPEQQQCHFDKIRGGDHVGNIPQWTMSDDPYRKLTVRNWADVELYVYAKHLFVEQASLVHEEAMAQEPTDPSTNY